MEIFITTLCITLIQIPGIILRYIPFAKQVTRKQKKQLIYCYMICFVFQNILFFVIITNTAINSLVYKSLLSFGAFSYLFINCMIIRGMFYQHAFIFGMQSNYILVLHSFAAIILSKYAHTLAPHQQILMQTFIYTALLTITAYPLWRFLKNSFIFNISQENTYHWKMIWLIPVLLCLSNVIGTMNENWISTWQKLASRLATGAATVVAWKYVNLDFNELKEKLSLRSANKLLHAQLKGIKHQAETIRENNEKISILRHDMRHHIQILSSLIDNGELSSASLLLAQLNDDLENTKPIIFCKNPIINSSLLVYINKAEKENIHITSKIDIPLDLPWNSNDIAILLANVLENAINASHNQKEGRKEIQISTKYYDQKLGIIVKNHFDDKVTFNDRGIPISTKEGHGIGMGSISSIVSKYHGTMVCSHEDQWFTISILFSEQFIFKEKKKTQGRFTRLF